MTTLTDTYGGSGAVSEAQTSGFNNISAKALQEQSKPKIGGWGNGLLENWKSPDQVREEKAEAIKKELEEKEKAELAHAEEREDTAYQRAIKDMRAAGWNTDGMTPQASASNARLNTERSEKAKDRELELEKLQKELTQAVKEKDKDRVIKIIEIILGQYNESTLSKKDILEIIK